jgi:hypothetical protein
VTLTELTKYDQDLNNCIGLTFIAEGAGSILLRRMTAQCGGSPEQTER